ncbi:Serine/arginine-rich splicing factor 2 [Araneus ventricosus]|uniref:Serine/arginine-rich splicing factor 2 n=1 Tax=Araneus ventricosus TaxID=182803 RepID=A0A4Y2SL87_ARAVE|nr:Serine/arginine-rich splicing factor 2 [Araneus ventricosus]
MSYSRVPNIDRTTSLKVDNLTDRVTPEDLQRAFEQFSIDDVYIPRHPCTGEHQGFAFVRFYDSRDAEEAMDALDGHLLDGRELRVQMAVPAISSGDPDRSLALSR